MSRRINIRFKIAVAVTAILAVLWACNILLSSQTQQRQAEGEMLEKAQILAMELDASWTFIEMNQDVINTDSDGEYNFKGIYCAVAGKSIAKLITFESDYTIRYTNLETRRQADAPDAFELEALEAFNADKDLKEYYGLVDGDGERVFRYLAPLRMEESCLECHGEPAGELDRFGFAKEGRQVGDLGGAISITMPVDTYLGNIQHNITQQMILLAATVVVCAAFIMLVVNKLVSRPLAEVEAAASRIEEGDFRVSLKGIGSQDEIEDLARHFESMAHKLGELTENLEQKVEMRTAQLEEANEMLVAQRKELERANELLREESACKSDFLAIMSHELRTPLTSILAYAEMWQGKLSGEDAAAKAVGEILENGQILLGMIDNVLISARIEAGSFETVMEPIDMVDLVDTVEGTVDFLAKKRGITALFDVSADVPLFMGDWDKLRRIFVNLVSNAIKFTKRGGQVKMEVSYDFRAGDIVVAVSDNGIGIKEEDLAKIFDRFTQVGSSVKKRQNGSGLGLFVVRDLVRVHGGTIEVKSEYQKGSVFTVKIPARGMDGNPCDLAERG